MLTVTTAYVELRSMYALFAHQMTPAEFNDFTSSASPSSQTFKILQAHFVALQLIMNPAAKIAAVDGAKCPVREPGRAATVGWLTALHAEIDKKKEKYCTWTRFVEREVLGGRLLDGSAARSVCIFVDEGSDGSESPKTGSRPSSTLDSSNCPRSRDEQF